MYVVREFRIGEQVRDEYSASVLSLALEYACDASQETDNPVNVVDGDEDVVVATFREGGQTFYNNDY